MATLAPMKSVVAHKPPAVRAEVAQAAALLGLMAVVAVPAGVDATLITQDALVGLAAAGMAALMMVALLQMLGVLGGR